MLRVFFSSKMNVLMRMKETKKRTVSKVATIVKNFFHAWPGIHAGSIQKQIFQTWRWLKTWRWTNCQPGRTWSNSWSSQIWSVSQTRLWAQKVMRVVSTCRWIWRKLWNYQEARSMLSFVWLCACVQPEVGAILCGWRRGEASGEPVGHSIGISNLASFCVVVFDYDYDCLVSVHFLGYVPVWIDNTFWICS